MLIRLNNVTLAELESALKYTGLYVQRDDSDDNYAEIKAIPDFILRDDFHKPKPYTTLELWEKLGDNLKTGERDE